MSSLIQTSECDRRDLEVLRWRYDELRRAGFDRVNAELLAADAAVDLHVATKLLRTGCSEELAVRILH